MLVLVLGSVPALGYCSCYPWTLPLSLLLLRCSALLTPSPYHPHPPVPQEVFPCAVFCERRNYDLKDIVKFANNREFSDLIVFNEDKNKINGMLLVHLPDGPTVRCWWWWRW